MAVTQIGRQHRQLALDVDAASVPLHQGLDRQAVSIIPSSE